MYYVSLIKIPAITGEILAGIVLGPTMLGRTSPEFQNWLFPSDVVQWTMLETVSWLGVFFSFTCLGFSCEH